MNDERPIEKLLRRYARKRRDEAGAPLELHPATRRRLQGEVVRQFPKPATERGGSFAVWFTVLRRRWIYATAAVGIVLLVVGVLLWPSQPEGFGTKPQELALAKSEAAPAQASDKSVAVGK